MLAGTIPGNPVRLRPSLLRATSCAATMSSAAGVLIPTSPVPDSLRERVPNASRSDENDAPRPTHTATVPLVGAHAAAGAIGLVRLLPIGHVNRCRSAAAITDGRVRRPWLAETRGSPTNTAVRSRH